MFCQHARCVQPAAIALRFGDGSFLLDHRRMAQPRVVYCLPHGELVERLFHVCDVEELAGKECSRCRRWLPAVAFRPNPKLRSGLASWCRDCQNAATQRWRAEHPELKIARREGPFPTTCVDCSHGFLAARRRQVRCRDCQAATLKARKR